LLRITFPQIKKDNKRKLANIRKERIRRSPLELASAILTVLRCEETVTRALRRLSGKSGKEIPGKRSIKPLTREPKAALTSDDNKESLALLMECADELLSLGVTDIYGMTYDQLSNSLANWEYKGQDGGDTVHGPFTAEQIMSWRLQGYFVGPSAVQMRPVGSLDDAWVASDTTEFAELPQLKILTSRALPLPEDSESDDESGEKVTLKHRAAGINHSHSRREEAADDDDDRNSDVDADTNLRGKRTKGFTKTGGRKYTSKDDSESDADD
jgi:hypothetical protein